MGIATCDFSADAHAGRRGGLLTEDFAVDDGGRLLPVSQVPRWQFIWGRSRVDDRMSWIRPC